MRFLIKFCIVTLLLITTTSTAYAHRMTIVPISEGVIKANYEDGSFSDLTVITVYNSNKEVIYVGNLDENGYFYFDVNSGAARIVADDKMGHRVVWNVGDPISYSTSYKWLKVSIVVILLMLVSVLFHLRTKKHKLRISP